MVHGRGFLYNSLAHLGDHARCGSSRVVFPLPRQGKGENIELQKGMAGGHPFYNDVVKKVLEICSFNSERLACVAVRPSYLDTEIESLSRNVNIPKSSPCSLGKNIHGDGKHSLLKLELSLLPAYRYYSTTLSSGNGTRKKRKRPAISPIDGHVCLEPRTEILSQEDGMKRRDVLISSTTSPNATDLAAISNTNNGRPGVFDSLRNLEKENGKFRKIIRIIADVDMLKYAYELLKSKPGNATTAADCETLNGINEKWFIKTSNTLLSGEYRFKPARLVDIPKANGEKRPIVNGNPRDKIVQKACEIVLNYIYEVKLKKFSDNAHGFRSNYGCHTALKQIKYNWKAIPWYLEFDIKKAFNSINRKRLISIIEEEIGDRALTTLIDKMFNAKVLSGKEMLSLSEGVPQGNIMSPLLSNIYFSKLDEKLDFLMKKFKKGKEPTPNNEYLQIIRISEAEKRGKSESELRKIQKSRVLLARKKGIYPTIHDENYCRIRYVRYADNFIIGVRGHKQVASQVFDEVKNFLGSSLHLQVNLEKSRITHIYSDAAQFLGMRINCPPTSQISFRRAAHIERFRRLQLRVKRKFENAEKRRLKLLQQELVKQVRNDIKTLGMDNVRETLLELCKNLSILDLVKDSNIRGVYRKIAEEFKQLPPTDGDEELLKILGELKAWSMKDNRESLADSSDHEIKLVPITMKEVGDRIISKFGNILELKANKNRFRFNNAEDAKNINITKLPEDFQLTPSEIQQIKTKFTKKDKSRRLLEVIRILSDRQKEFTGPDTMITNPVTLAVRKA